MRCKWAIRLTLLLLLGAVVNIAVAWGCALTQPPMQDDSQMSEELAARLYREFALRTWITPAAFDGMIFKETFGTSGSAVVGFLRQSSTDRITGIGWRSYGVPFRSMRAMFWDEDLQRVLERRVFIFGRTFPVLLIWPGFAIDSAFYAATLWLFIFAGGKVRRAIRRHRGLCPACAYPVGSSPVCTECGLTLSLR